MRTFFQAVVVLFLLTSALFGVQHQSFSRYVPDDVILFAEVQDLEPAWDTVVNSNFWRKFSSLKILEDANVPDRIAEIKQEFKSITGFRLSRENVMALIGRKFAVSVHAEHDEKDGPVKIEVVFIAQSNPKKTVEDIISKLLDKAKEEMGREALFTSVIYNTVKIHSIKPKNENLNIEIRYVYDGDVLIIGVGNMQPRIEKYLDCSIKKENSLERLPQYLKVRTITSPIRRSPLLSMYIDISKLDAIKKSVNEEDLDLLAIVDGIANFFETGSAIGLSVVADKGIRAKTIVLPTKVNPSDLEKLTMAVQPAAGVNRNYIPLDTILYLAANNMPNPVKVYPEVLKKWQADPKKSFFAQFIEQIELSLDIEIQKDLLPFVGNEMAFLFSGVEIKEFDFPMPLAALMINVKDKDKADAFMEKLKKTVCNNVNEGNLKIEFKPEFHEGMKIYFLEIPNPAESGARPLKPCYVFMDDFLVIGSSVEQIKSMIDVSKGRKRGLVGSSLYRMSGIPDRTNELVFINWEEMTNNARLITDWLIKFAESAGIGEEAKEKSEDHIKPIIDTLSAIRYISTYSLNTPQGRETNLYIRLEDLPDI